MGVDIETPYVASSGTLTSVGNVVVLYPSLHASGYGILSPVDPNIGVNIITISGEYHDRFDKINYYTTG